MAVPDEATRDGGNPEMLRVGAEEMQTTYLRQSAGQKRPGEIEASASDHVAIDVLTDALRVREGRCVAVGFHLNLHFSLHLH